MHLVVSRVGGVADSSMTGVTVSSHLDFQGMVGILMIQEVITVTTITVVDAGVAVGRTGQQTIGCMTC